MRGGHERVAPLLTRVLAAVDTSDYREFAARSRHAAGLAALAQGRYLAAYAQLRPLFAADGSPLHHHFSYLAIADLAATAARADRRLEARTLLERALSLVDPAPGPRLEQLAARASQALPTAPGVLDGLTAQQREIVILAGRGLTNAEIADRLFLSPRTVASHLYRSYPKLGIAGRHQIHDLIDHQGTLQASA
jgi:DNA-binding CsgD family transcriptional regulator